MPTSQYRKIGFQRRRRHGDTEAPTFFAYDSATGLQPVDGIDFDDWGSGEATDATTNELYLSLELKNVSPASTTKLQVDVVSHVKIGDSYYEFKGGRKTHGMYNDWVLRCSISADRHVAS